MRIYTPLFAPPAPIEYVPALPCLFLHWSVTSWLKVVWYCLRVFVLVIRSAMIADCVCWLSGDGKPTISKLIKLYWQARTDRPPDACTAPAPNHKRNEWLLLKRLATDIALCISISQKACIASTPLWCSPTLEGSPDFCLFLKRYSWLSNALLNATLQYTAMEKCKDRF